MSVTPSELRDKSLQRGNELVRSGDLDGALAAFDFALEVDPGTARAHLGRGWVHAQRGETEQPIAQWTRAIDLDPSLDEAHPARAAARTAVRDDAGAVSDWEAALRLRRAMEPTLGLLAQPDSSRPAFPASRRLFRLTILACPTTPPPSLHVDHWAWPLLDDDGPIPRSARS